MKPYADLLPKLAGRVVFGLYFAFAITMGVQGAISRGARGGVEDFGAALLVPVPCAIFLFASLLMPGWAAEFLGWLFVTLILIEVVCFAYAWSPIGPRAPRVQKAAELGGGLLVLSNLVLNTVILLPKWPD